MRFTPKQRERIYRLAAETVFKTGCGGCRAIYLSTHKLTPFYEFKYVFAEFYLFENIAHCGCFWWYDKEPRILALLFAAEMTKKQ